MGILSKLFGSDDGHGTAERILAASATGLVERAAPPTVPAVVPGPPPAGWVHPFFRGGEDAGTAKTLARPYERSAWVQRAIRHVGEPITARPLRFATMTTDGLKAYINPALAAFWDWPAIGPKGPLSRAALIEATNGWLNLFGEAFWILGEDWLVYALGGSAVPGPFIVARPDQMRSIVSQDGGRLVGWLFRDAAGQDHELLPEQVIHTPFWNPYDSVRGCAPYAGARVAAEADAFAGDFNRNLMAGNGDRGPIISSKGQLSEPQMLQIEKNLLARKAAAQAGTLKLSFLPADIDVHDPQVAQVDAEFVASRIENRKEIYMAFGVPASFADQQPNATTAIGQDRFTFIEDTVEPMAARIAAPIADLAMRLLKIDRGGPDHLFAYFDFSQHSVKIKALAERADAALKFRDLGVPLKDINAALGLQLPRIPGDDVGHLPTTVQTVETANGAASVTPPAPPAKKPSSTPAASDDPTALMLRALAVPAPSPLEAALAAPVVTRDNGPRDDDTGQFTHADERERLWNRHMRLRRPAEKAMQRAVNTVLFKARSEVLRKLEATAKRVGGTGLVQRDDDKGSDTPPAAHPGTALDVMFEPGAFTADLMIATQNVSRGTFQTAGVEVRAELGIEDPWTAEAGEVFNAIGARANLIQGASDEVFQDVLGDLGKGYEAGETTAQLAERVRAKFNDMSRGRSETIAQTETGAIYGAGRTAGAISVGAKTKSWLSSRDAKVRPTHKAADGQSVMIDGLFHVGADTMPSPCNGSTAEENVNCRCVSLFHV